VDVQQIPFEWDITMSRKLDTEGNIVGQYTVDDLRDNKRDGKRFLEFDPTWIVTEMLVKLHIQPIFPTAEGPLAIQNTRQLSKNSLMNFRINPREPISKDLEKDTELTSATINNALATAAFAAAQEQGEEVVKPPSLKDIHGEIGAQQVQDLLRQPDTSSPGLSRAEESTGNGESSSEPQNTLGSRYGSCYACRLDGLNCDKINVLINTNDRVTCSECRRKGLECTVVQPNSIEDREQVVVEELLLRGIRRGKRKLRGNDETGALEIPSTTSSNSNVFDPRIWDPPESPPASLVSASEQPPQRQPSARGRPWTAYRSKKKGKGRPRKVKD
jgi:hypothetical protein